MSSISKTGKFTFTDANKGGTRTLTVPFPYDDVDATSFENSASIMSALWTGFGAYGNWWTETDITSDKLDIDTK